MISVYYILFAPNGGLITYVELSLNCSKINIKNTSSLSDLFFLRHIYEWHTQFQLGIYSFNIATQGTQHLHDTHQHDQLKSR